MDSKGYFSQQLKTADVAREYSKTHGAAYRYLAFRDIPKIINGHAEGKKALDYGSGSGFSADFLHRCGLDVHGVDVDPSMLREAQQQLPHIPFYLANRGAKLPFHTQTYDVVFSSFVLLEMGNREHICSYLSEAHRVMKDNGVLIALTGSRFFHSADRSWLHFGTDFPENQNLISGNQVRLFLRETAIEFIDYYWTEQDYRDCMEMAGFAVEEVHSPLACPSEPFDWLDELNMSPYVILVGKKK